MSWRPFVSRRFSRYSSKGLVDSPWSGGAVGWPGCSGGILRDFLPGSFGDQSWDENSRPSFQTSYRCQLGSRCAVPPGHRDERGATHVSAKTRSCREGEIVFRQGEPGGRFFIIESGNMEIVREEPDRPPQRRGTRSAGTSFGELALLNHTPRTATVRCLTPVNVVMFSREDFHALAGSFHSFREHILDQVAHLVTNAGGSRAGGDNASASAPVEFLSTKVTALSPALTL
ncbi:MAG: cyclic nucleotide-binding domain-containing protein [bacterium]